MKREEKIEGRGREEEKNSLSCKWLRENGSIIVKLGRWK
jgi:hypothetical protein